jgi:hypothetical protein
LEAGLLALPPAAAAAAWLWVEAAGLPERQRPHLLQVVRAQPSVVTAYWCEGTQCNG